MRRASGVCAIIACVPLAAAQGSHARTAALQTTAQPASQVELGDLAIRDAFVQLLRGARLPGGLEFVHCYDAVPRLIVARTSTIESGLRRITAAQPDLSLLISDDGVVELRSSSQPRLLDVHIANVELPDTLSSMGAVRRILDSREVQAKATELGLAESHVEPGYPVVRRPGEPPLAPRPLTLRGATLREVLNALAKLRGAGVWVYEERGCSAGRTYSISFAAY